MWTLADETATGVPWSALGLSPILPTWWLLFPIFPPRGMQLGGRWPAEVQLYFVGPVRRWHVDSGLAHLVGKRWRGGSLSGTGGRSPAIETPFGNRALRRICIVSSLQVIGRPSVRPVRLYSRTVCRRHRAAAGQVAVVFFL